MKLLSETETVGVINTWLGHNRYIIGVNELDGWFYNRFFVEEIPYLWRSNARCSRARLSYCLKRVLNRLGLQAPAIIFHENLGGWKNDNATLGRCLLLDPLEDLFFLLEKHMWNIGKESAEHSPSDNYNVIFLEHDVCLVFTHENEICMFSRGYDFLKLCAEHFRSYRFNTHMSHYDTK